MKSVYVFLWEIRGENKLNSAKFSSAPPKLDFKKESSPLAIWSGLYQISLEETCELGEPLAKKSFKKIQHCGLSFLLDISRTWVIDHFGCLGGLFRFTFFLCTIPNDPMHIISLSIFLIFPAPHNFVKKHQQLNKASPLSIIDLLVVWRYFYTFELLLVVAVQQLGLPIELLLPRKRRKNIVDCYSTIGE